MQASVKRPQFYFINKSASSSNLSKSASKEKSEIQQHVQKGIKRSRPRGKKGHEVQAKPECSHSKTGNSIVEPQAICHEVVRVPQWTIPQPGSRSVLCKLDPFSASPLHIDKRVASLLHYYKYYYHPSQWPNEMVVLRHGLFVFEEAVLHVLRNAIQDHLTMYCLLAASASRLQFVDKLSGNSLVGVENYYISEALRLMNYNISINAFEEDQNFNQLLTCILLLGSADAYRDNISGARLHLEMTARLLSAKGGLNTLSDEVLKGQLAMSDLFLACIHLKPCLFDCSYDPGPLSSLCLGAHELDRSIKTSSAQCLLDQTVPFMTEELRYLAEAVIETHTVKTQAVTSSMPPERAMAVMHWITLRNMAIRHKLLAIHGLCQAGHVLRISIIMWTLLAMNVTGRAKTVKIMASKLKDALSMTGTSSWTDFLHIKLWFVLLGVFCAQDESDIYCWFIKECHKLLDQPILRFSAEVSTSELAARLEAFQRMFFYDESVQSSRNIRLAQTLNQI